MTRVHCQPALAGVVLATTLSLVACGGGGGGGGAGSGPAAAAPAASTVMTPPPSPGPAAPPPPAPPPADTGTPGLTCAPGDAPLMRATLFALMNVVRNALQLPEYTAMPGMSAAAQAHAQYAIANASTGPDEQPSLPCYTGATLQQRLSDAGVQPLQLPGVRPHSESVLSYATPSGVDVQAMDVINDALNNLYGRLLMLAPHPQQAGVGFSVQPGGQQRALVVDTALLPSAATASEALWVVWPRDGATGLPPRMHPSNLKPLDAALSEGYPASLHAVAPVQVSRFVMAEAATDAPVAATVITSATDRNSVLGRGEAALVPHAPLASATQYRVELDAVVGAQAVHHAWTFTTAP
jgi:hypothetical protein